MGGTCTDYSASPRLGNGASSPISIDGTNFCAIQRGALRGIVTYDDGRVVRLVGNGNPQRNAEESTRLGVDVFDIQVYASPDAGPLSRATRTIRAVTQAQIDLIRSMQASEIGVCYNNGFNVQVQPFPMTAGPWTASHNAGVLRLFGDTPDRVFMCVDGRSGEMGINTNSGMGVDIRNAAALLRRDEISALGPGFDDAHYQLVLRALNGLAPNTETNHREYALWGILVFVIGGVLSHVIGHFLTNRRPPNPPGGGGGDGTITPQQQAAIDAAVAAGVRSVLGALGLTLPAPAAQPAQPAADPNAAPQPGPQAAPRVSLVMGEGNSLLLDTLAMGSPGRPSVNPVGVDAIDVSGLPAAQPGSATVLGPVGGGIISVPSLSPVPVFVP